MKKHNPSSGQNDQLVHWWLLIHSGHIFVDAHKVVRCNKDSSERCPVHGVPKTNKFKALEERKRVFVLMMWYTTLGEVKFVIYVEVFMSSSI